MRQQDILQKYISFFEKRGHKRIANSSLVPQNDPTTLFTSSGMQPLVSYLLGEPHPQGKRLVNVQNCFRAADIDEVGDNRHTTFFRMLGNWSLGDYFKKEQLPWFWEFLVKEVELDADRLYVSVFEGYQGVPKDVESYQIWKGLGLSDGHIFFYGVDKNWWSRSGPPDKMPDGEIGGPDSEVFFEFTSVEHDRKYGDKCHPNCNCGRFLEIGNSVFIQYQKQKDGSLKELSQKNVDFGGGLERLLAAVENQQDIFQTSLFSSIVQTIELQTGKNYLGNESSMRIVADHFVAATFITASGIIPSNKEQGYILRRLIRRGLDNFYLLGDVHLRGVHPNFAKASLGESATSEVIRSIVEQYKDTDPILVEKFEHIKGVLLEEAQTYERTRAAAKQFIHKKYPIGDELKGTAEISADDAFVLYATHGLSPTQIKSLGFVFDDQSFAEKMKEHQKVSRAGAEKKFAGGLADQSPQTIKGHTATHLLHQALRDVLGNTVHQTGSNITSQRVRFDFNFDRKLTEEELRKIEDIVNTKIKANLAVHFEMMGVDEAKRRRAIGLFEEKYGEKVKVYFINNYSAEFCGGPHVDFTGKLKRFTITKEESLGSQQRRIYAVVE